MSSILFVNRARSENAADRARNHQLFIRTNDAHGDATGLGGDHRRILLISRLVQFDAKEAKSFADACANGRVVLSNATGEHQRIQSTKGGGERADPLLRLI